MAKRKILILGAGVSGLSTGVFLLQEGHEVCIWAREFSPNTTSDKAAAFWYPFLCNPQDKALRWSAFTLDYLKREIVPNPASGCVARWFNEYFDEPVDEPWWRPAVKSFRKLGLYELPDGYWGGHTCETVVMDTSIYLRWLMMRFLELGGLLEQHTITDISDVLSPDHVLVNCTGLGSYDLLDDKEMYPIRGQIAKVRNPDYRKVLTDDAAHNQVLYIVPRVNDIVLGGTAQVGNWNTEIDPLDTVEIMRKVALVAPELVASAIIEQRVGLRPGRSEIRLEVENINGNYVVHNYGHGGAGYTLSWGCAAEVAGIVEAIPQ